MANEASPGESRKANGAVVLGSALTGIAGMAFIVLTERSMTTPEFESLGHLWTIWSVAGAVATFAVQQWIISARRSGFVPLAELLTMQLLAAIVLLSAAVFGFTAAFRTDLFASTGFGWPAAAAVIPIGSVAIGLTRALWATENRFTGLGFIIALENLLRLFAAATLALIGARSGWFAGALLLGFAAAVVAPRRREQRLAVDPEQPSTNLLLATAAAGFFSHTTINGGPIVLAITGATDAPVAEMFIVLAIARLPLLLAVHGLLPIYAVRVNSMIVRGDAQGIANTRRTIAVVGLIVAVAVGTVGAFVAPPVADIVFDTADQLGRLDYGLAFMLTILAGAALTANTALVAEGRIRFQLLAWGVPVVAGFGLLAVVDEPTARTVLAVVVAVEVCIFLLVTVGASATRGTVHIESDEPKVVDQAWPPLGQGDE